MEIVSIEADVFGEMLSRFEIFARRLEAVSNRCDEKRLTKWLDNEDVCLMLGISPRTLQTFRDNGTLAFSQVNRKCYYKIEDVERIIKVK